MALWSILSLSVCFATPSITTRYFRATSGSIREDDLVLALSTATGAALGFALAALGYSRKESPRLAQPGGVRVQRPRSARRPSVQTVTFRSQFLTIVKINDYSQIMKRVNVSEFKATCLRLLDRVRETGEPLEILKNGKPLAVVQPPAASATKPKFGSMKAALFSGPLGDVMTPATADSEWEVLK